MMHNDAYRQVIRTTGLIRFLQGDSKMISTGKMQETSVFDL